MAAAVAAEPLFFTSRRRSLISPSDGKLTPPLRMGKLHPKVSPSLSMALSSPCAAGTLNLEPTEVGSSSSTPISDTGPADGVVGKVGGKDRRRAVRIAWEKLVRWSRSWRSKAKSDVLERTKKVVVLGGGSFGTAMAAHVASKKAEMEVSMLLRDADACRSINEAHCNRKYFPEYKLPGNIIATTNPKLALQGADFCLHAVPVQFILS